VATEAPPPQATTSELGLSSVAHTADSEPWDFFARIRAAGGIVWDDEMGLWLVASYELNRQIGLEEQVVWQHPGVPSEDNETFGLSRQEWLDFMGYGSALTPSVSEGPEHDRIHRWWMRAFSGRALVYLGDTLIRPIAHGQLDRFADRGHADLHSEFAERVAPRVIAAAMGLPWQDDDWLEHVLALHRQRIALIATRIGLDHADPAPELVERGRAAVEELGELVRPYVEERRGGDGDDFISIVWRDAEAVFGPRFSIEDVIGTVNVAFAGGSSTTADATANGLYLLLTRPDLAARIRNGEEKALSSFVEESLRLYGPLLMRARLAKKDTELGGVRIRKGEWLLAIGGSGNRDDAHYGHPADVELERKGPRDHFAFHFGARTCPGQGLARMQLATIFDVLLERLDDLRLDPDAEPPRYRDYFRRKWRPLNALFTLTGSPR
jgi:cytochrome P450